MKPHKAPVNSLNSHTLSLTRTENQRKNKDAKKKKTTTTTIKKKTNENEPKWNENFLLTPKDFHGKCLSKILCVRARKIFVPKVSEGVSIGPISPAPFLPLLQHLPCPNPKHLITLLLLLGGNKILNVPLNPSTGNVISASWLLSSPKNQRRCWRRGNPREERPEKFRMGDTR